MSTLFEINKQILECVDEESGEIIDIKRLEELQVERDSKIKNIAQWYRNLIDDAESFKTNANYFARKANMAQKKAESLKEWLQFALQGEKFEADDKTISISYRKSKALVICDEARFVREMQSLDRDDLLTYKEPTPNAAAIKEAIKSGAKFDGVEIVEKQNIQIK